MLEELNDEFVRRLDKKSYGGERFVRVIGNKLFIQKDRWGKGCMN